jgi:uncharacterized caspase-like protein
LYLLTVGVNQYGDKANNLHLDFAEADAVDVASALAGGTQDSLYSEVRLQLLTDSDGNRSVIFVALDAMRKGMALGRGQDFAIFFFSGHGVMVDGELYLLPYGVDARSAALIKSTAIPALLLQGELIRLAENGRVPVLLDACHAGATSADGNIKHFNADAARSIRTNSAIRSPKLSV